MTVALASFADCVDLASDALGGEVLTATDDFFAAKENLLKDAPAVFDPKAYTDRGKLMDGWESRRKRTSGHDSCILRLGVPGLVRGFDIDTSWFMGNQPQFGSIEGCVAPAGLSGEELAEFDGWTEILGQVPLDAGSHNLFAASRVDEFTHLRLHIYPDGGVARLRVYGIPRPSSAVGADLDLAALQSGGRAIGASDMFYGDANNLLRPGRAENMGGGWETKRRRDTGHDWVVVRLAGRGTIRRVGCIKRGVRQVQSQRVGKAQKVRPIRAVAMQDHNQLSGGFAGGRCKTWAVEKGRKGACHFWGNLIIRLVSSGRPPRKVTAVFPVDA